MAKKKQGDIKYRSHFEANTAYWLTSRGIKFVYEGEKLPYRTRVKGGICGSCGKSPVFQVKSYLPDFFFPDYGFYIETKGRLTSKDRTKMKDVVEANKKADIRLVFMYDNKIKKDKDERYSDWAAKNGFKYSVGIPESRWFKLRKSSDV